MSTLPWNVATKDLDGHELLRKKLKEKIKKPETRMKYCPAGAVIGLSGSGRCYVRRSGKINCHDN
jgi:hypothetical protein